MPTYSLFLTDKDSLDIEYVFDFADSLPGPSGKLLYEDLFYRAYSDEGKILRYIGFYDGKGTVLNPSYALVEYDGDSPKLYRVTVPLDMDVPFKAAFVYRTL